ncbi:MAG: RdgB/HAM1 family non-canonical purine NTP pyrophosphatase [Candidatus Heimdallarchaeota archaeon]
MREISCVTSNPHKFAEFSRILSLYSFSIAQLNRPKIEIQADSLEEIAVYSIDQISDTYCFLEDAGIFIDILNGFPGPYSAYVFRTLGCVGILQLMKNHENRLAQFVSVIVFRDPAGKKTIFRGETIGTIAFEECGTGGFGFDPVFIPEGTNKTYAEISPSEKDTISHRGKAARDLTAFLNMQNANEDYNL